MPLLQTSEIMNVNKQDREGRVTLSEVSRSPEFVKGKGLSRWARRCFAALSMTLSVSVVKFHHRGTPTINRGATTTDREQVRERTQRPRRAIVWWPWLLVAAAWGVLVLATLTHTTFLLDHHYLLQASGLPWLAAFEIFLLCWQFMTVAMMLPSSMPMVHLVVYAGRRQAHPLNNHFEGNGSSGAGNSPAWCAASAQ